MTQYARMYAMMYQGKFVHPTDAQKLYTLKQVLARSEDFLFPSESAAKEARKCFPEIMRFQPKIHKLLITIETLGA